MPKSFQSLRNALMAIPERKGSTNQMPIPRLCSSTCSGKAMSISSPIHPIKSAITENITISIFSFLMTLSPMAFLLSTPTFMAMLLPQTSQDDSPSFPVYVTHLVPASLIDATPFVIKVTFLIQVSCWTKGTR